jgi:putative GTP pyrophosphokinase
VKSKDRFLEKARRKGATADSVSTQVRDLAGVRVTCKNVQDVDEVARIIEGHPDLNVVEVEDHHGHPTEAGYRARHVIVRTKVAEGTSSVPVECEVQLMTLLQDAWAEFAHEDLYEDGSAPPRLVRSAKRVAELLSGVDDILQDIREELESPALAEPESDHETGGTAPSRGEIQRFYQQATGEALTVGQALEAVVALAVAVESLECPGLLTADVWQQAWGKALPVFVNAIGRPPDDFEVLRYGVPLAWGADEDVAIAALVEQYDLVECTRCGRLTPQAEAYSDERDTFDPYCDECAAKLPCCVRCSVHTDAGLPNDPDPFCRACESYIREQ